MSRPKYKIGPVGRLAVGHVLDVAKAPLERMLQDYDAQLYLKWNASKCYGWGCWEVRRRPNQKSIKDVVEYKGMSFVQIDYVENNFESHVMDVAYLNYDCLTRLRAMDLWNENQKYFVDNLESREATHVAEQKAKAKAEMLYHAKQEKNLIREYREAILSGTNPADLAKFWK